MDDYIQEKTNQNIEIFKEIDKLVNKKLYIIIQNLSFNHLIYNINKQIFVFIILESLWENRLTNIYLPKLRKVF